MSYTCGRLVKLGDLAEMRKATWNSLPARPEDVERVRRVLRRGETRLSELPTLAALSKTRTLCAIDQLLQKGEVKEAERGYVELNPKACQPSASPIVEDDVATRGS